VISVKYSCWIRKSYVQNQYQDAGRYGTCSSILGEHGGAAVSVLSVRKVWTAKRVTDSKAYDPGNAEALPSELLLNQPMRQIEAQTNPMAARRFLVLSL